VSSGSARWQIAIVTDDPGWHGRRLRLAFAARGADSHFVSLTRARLELDDEPRVVLPGFEHRLPDAVFVRGVPGGSLEQVVFHLNVLHALSDLGVPVYNDGRAIERSVDKGLTSLRLQQAGLATPPTWICSEREQVEQRLRRELALGHPLVCKPLFGSQGQGVRLVRSIEELPDAEAMRNVWYLQRFVGASLTQGCDWRVFVIAGRAVAAMRRSGQGWLANVAQGGRCQAALPKGELSRLAEDAVACLDMAYAGVDLIRDGDGRWWLIEVNSIPAWKGLQGVTRVDIAGALADDLLARVRDGAVVEVRQ
jgi:RimK family alpha-L-glutamate ligase